MKIEEVLTKKQMANLRDKHSAGMSRRRWDSDDQVVAIAKKLAITTKELRARIGYRAMGVYGI
jgi:hypothetical protein